MCAPSADAHMRSRISRTLNDLHTPPACAGACCVIGRGSGSAARGIVRPSRMPRMLARGRWRRAPMLMPPHRKRCGRVHVPPRRMRRGRFLVGCGRSPPGGPWPRGPAPPRVRACASVVVAAARARPSWVRAFARGALVPPRVSAAARQRVSAPARQRAARGLARGRVPRSRRRGGRRRRRRAPRPAAPRRRAPAPRPAAPRPPPRERRR